MLLVPAPTISCADRSAQARAQTSMTACFSSFSSAADSPVVPRATMPAAPASRNPCASPSSASSATLAVRPKGVTAATYTPRKFSSLAM